MAVVALVTRGRCVCGCGRRGQQRHHVVTRQELRLAARRLGVSAASLERDDRNLVWITPECHGAHHGGSARVAMHLLPDSVFEFAAEVLGPGPAYNYIGRYYAGSDMRRELLLAA